MGDSGLGSGGGGNAAGRGISGGFGRAASKTPPGAGDCRRGLETNHAVGDGHHIT